MGVKYTERVYKSVKVTSSTEQAVLAYIAHRANDQTGQCYPRIDRIASETHFARSAVMRALDTLKEKGLLIWTSGGRTKGGRSLSNLYTITLPLVDKSVDKSVDNFKENAHEETSVLQEDRAVSSRRTEQCPPGGQSSVLQEDTNIHIIKNKNTGNITRPEGREKTGSERFDYGVKRRGKVALIGDMLKDVVIPPPPPHATSPDQEAMKKDETPPPPPRAISLASLVQEAMKAAGVTDEANRRAFASVMKGRDPMRCLKVSHQFRTELTQGKMANVRSIPALLMTRLKNVELSPE